jgi:hypothetical protein
MRFLQPGCDTQAGLVAMLRKLLITNVRKSGRIARQSRVKGCSSSIIVHGVLRAATELKRP